MSQLGKGKQMLRVAHNSGTARPAPLGRSRPCAFIFGNLAKHSERATTVNLRTQIE